LNEIECYHSAREFSQFHPGARYFTHDTWCSQLFHFDACFIPLLPPVIPLCRPLFHFATRYSTFATRYSTLPPVIPLLPPVISL
jgi:hypothetical protein